MSSVEDLLLYPGFSNNFNLINSEDQDLINLLGDITIICMIDKEELVGYTILEDNESYQDLLFIEISSKLRGGGLGRRLLKHSIDNSKETKLYPINDPALKFFQRMAKLGVIKKLTILDYSS